MSYFPRASDEHEQSLSAVELSKPQRLQFTVPRELEAEMDRAKQVLDRLVGEATIAGTRQVSG